MTLRKLTTCLAAFLFVVATCVTAAAQGRATLRGSVNDEVGAVIVGATITLTDPSGAQKTATTGNDGTFTFTGLTPGKYLLRAEAGGFAQSDDIEVNVTTARRDPTLITLKVAQIESEVKVESNPPISTDSNSNANQQVLSGKDLEALPDDPDELAAALQALAGPSIGPGGGQIFIDGFSGANLPTITIRNCPSRRVRGRSSCAVTSGGTPLETTKLGTSRPAESSCSSANRVGHSTASARL